MWPGQFRLIFCQGPRTLTVGSTYHTLVWKLAATPAWNGEAPTQLLLTRQIGALGAFSRELVEGISLQIGLRTLAGFRHVD